MFLFVFTPLLIRGMGTSGYGVWALALSTLGFMGVFELGLGTALAKFIAEDIARSDTEALSRTVTGGAVMYLSIGVVLTVPVFLGASWLSPHFASDDVASEVIGSALRVASLGFVPQMLRSGALAVPMGMQRFRPILVLSNLHSLATLVGALLVMTLGGTIPQIVAGSVGAQLLVSLAALLVAGSMLRNAGAEVRFSMQALRKMRGFLFFTSTTGIGTTLFTWLDRLIVGAILGVAQLAIYSVATSLAVKILHLADHWSRPLMPASSAVMVKEGPRAVGSLLKGYTLRVALAAIAVAGAGWFLAEPFLELWVGPGFAGQAADALRILIVVYAVIATNAPAYHVANGVGVPWICALGAVVGGLSALALIAVLADAAHIEGAALGNAGYFLTLLIPWYMVKRLGREARAAGAS